jgi:hypothetical protein
MALLFLTGIHIVSLTNYSYYGYEAYNTIEYNEPTQYQSQQPITFAYF